MHVLFLVPEGKGNVLQTVRITDTSDTVLTPTEGAGACHVMREIYRLISEIQPQLCKRYVRLHASPSALRHFVSR
jgi:hypothetical protein